MNRNSYVSRSTPKMLRFQPKPPFTFPLHFFCSLGAVRVLKQACLYTYLMFIFYKTGFSCFQTIDPIHLFIQAVSSTITFGPSSGGLKEHEPGGGG